MNLKVPKKTNSFLVWSFNDILTVLLPLWLLCLISEFRYAPIDSFFAAPFYLSGNNWLGTGSFFFSAVLHKGGKYVAVAVAVSSLILFLLSYLKKFARLKPYRKVRHAFYFGLCAHHQRPEVLIRLSLSLVASSVRRKRERRKVFPCRTRLFRFLFVFPLLCLPPAPRDEILDFPYPRSSIRLDFRGWASGARRTFPLSFLCYDVFGLGYLRPVLSIIFLS